MTDTGLACVFSVEPNVPIEIADFPLPEVEPDAILVRMTIANICGSDLHVWRGEMSAPFETAPPGYGSGHEGTGQVARLGSNINTDSLGRPIQEGDRVVFAYFFPCNRCYACLDDRPNACPTRSSRFGPRTVAQPPYFTGTFAQYYYLRPGHYVFKAPDDLSDELLAPANCALCQVIQSFQEAGLRLGDTVVLQGAGGLGLYGAAVAREMGAGLIISIDRLSSRLEMAKRFGADVVIDASEISNSEDRIAKVIELADGIGANIVVDLAGVPAVIPEGLDMLRQGGVYVEVGGIWPTTVGIEPQKLVFGNRRIVAMSHYHPRILPQALGFLSRNKDRLPFDEMLSHKYPLTRVNEAFEAADWARASGDSTKVIRAALTPWA